MTSAATGGIALSKSADNSTAVISTKNSSSISNPALLGSQRYSLSKSMCQNRVSVLATSAQLSRQDGIDYDFSHVEQVLHAGLEYVEGIAAFLDCRIAETPAPEPQALRTLSLEEAVHVHGDA